MTWTGRNPGSAPYHLWDHGEITQLFIFFKYKMGVITDNL